MSHPLLPPKLETTLKTYLIQRLLVLLQVVDGKLRRLRLDQSDAILIVDVSIFRSREFALKFWEDESKSVARERAMVAALP